MPSPLNGDFATIFNWLPTAALILSKDGEAVAANDAFVAMAGVPRAAMLGAGWLDVVEPRDRHALEVSLGQTGRSSAANRTCLLTGHRLSIWQWRPWRGELLIACVTESSIAGAEFEPGPAEEALLVDLFAYLVQRIFWVGADVQSLIGEWGAMDERLTAVAVELESIVHDASSAMFKNIADDMMRLNLPY